ncbi:MAG: DUF5053 domain-containing protein [Muribaculaceae bacterium]|nr:DUF5053 domain-containing protein [Muribaculaceae bacterium]
MIQDKLNELGKLMDLNPNSSEVLALATEIKNACTTPEEEKAVEDFVGSRIGQLSKSINIIYEEAVKLQLGELGEMLNLSYIAKTYFKKSRAWLSQRVNGNCVNGKACRFTPAELDIFNNALRDMSARLSSVTVGY